MTGIGAVCLRCADGDAADVVARRAVAQRLDENSIMIKFSSNRTEKKRKEAMTLEISTSTATPAFSAEEMTSPKEGVNLTRSK